MDTIGLVKIIAMRYCVCIILFFACLCAAAQDGSWAYYGQDAGGSRYSSLKQINTRNAARLKVAWTSQTGELEKYKGTRAKEKAAFECTPVLVGRTLYVSTPSDRVLALDAATGRQQWVYDPEVNLLIDHSEISNRGVAVWPAGGVRAGRIFIGTIDGRLIGLDAATGHPAAGFGNNGAVDLTTGLGKDIAETSPPLVVGDLVVVGSSLGDNQRFDYPPGVVRAYDVHTGGLKWSWNP